MFIRLGSILKATPSRRKNSGAFLALQVRQAAGEILNRLFSDYPEDLAKGVKVKTFKNGVLTISCPPLVAAELHMRSSGLIKDINGVMGRGVVIQIKFRVT